MTAPSAPLDLPGSMLRGMTLRQAKIIDFIVEFIEDYGYPPSIRQIAREIECSVSSVHTDLLRLEELELIRRAPEQARAITVVERDGAAA